MNIGEILKSELDKRNMKVSELSKVTDIPSQTLYAIIKRDSNRVKIDTIRKISSALQIPITTFFDNSPFNIVSSEVIDEYKKNYGSVLNDEEIKLLLTSERCVETLILYLGYDFIYNNNDDFYYLIKDNNVYKMDYEDIERVKSMLLSYLRYIIFTLIEDDELEKVDISTLKDLINDNTED